MSYDLPATLRRIEAVARQRSQPLVTPKQEAEWERRKQAAVELVTSAVAALFAGRLTVVAFERIMTAAIRKSHAVAYAIGRGGALDDADRAALQLRQDTQLGFLRAWVAALTIGAGGALLLRRAGAAIETAKAVSEAEQANRAEMYIDAAKGSLFAGKAAAVGLPVLPAYPKDGQTRCLTRCYCGWNIDDLGGGDFDCYWMLNWTGIPEVHCEHLPTPRAGMGTA